MATARKTVSAGSTGRKASGAVPNSPLSSKSQSNRMLSAEVTAKAGKAVKSDRPSDKLNHKTIDPFSNTSKKSAFATLYSSGGVPCRIQHGSVKHKLSWDIRIEDVPFDPTLITLAEGLRETLHPFMFVARQGFKELLEVQDAKDKTIPILVKLMPGLRAALSHQDGAVFQAGLDSLSELSELVQAHLNPHVKNLLVPMSKRMTDKNLKDKVTDTLQTLEKNGGREAYTSIKSKIPTYCSVMQ